MRNLLTIAFYELKRILRDRRLFLIVLSQPIVIALIVGLVAYRDPKDIKVGLVTVNDNQISREFQDKLHQSEILKVSDYEKVDEGEIKAGKLRAFITVDIKDPSETGSNISVLHDPSGWIIKPSVEREIAQAKDAISKIHGEAINTVSYESKDSTPYSLKHFDYYASAMMVLLVVLVTLNLSGISITTERVSGTFERLSVTPYSKAEIIFGKALAQFIIGLMVVILGTVSLYLMFSISIGNLYLLMLINVLVAATAVMLGLLISSITYTVVESVELAMYVFFASVLTTGILAPMETAQKYFVYFVKLTPFYYGVDASRRINMVGAGWEQIAHNVYILLGFFVLFFVLSVTLLRKQVR